MGRLRPAGTAALSPIPGPRAEHGGPTSGSGWGATAADNLPDWRQTKKSRSSAFLPHLVPGGPASRGGGWHHERKRRDPNARSGAPLAQPEQGRSCTIALSRPQGERAEGLKSEPEDGRRLRLGILRDRLPRRGKTTRAVEARGRSPAALVPRCQCASAPGDVRRRYRVAWAS